MSSGENILNAFYVVKETYKSLKKLLDELEEVAIKNEAEGIVSGTPKFLRWKADTNTDGWFLTSAIKLFQKVAGESLEQGVMRKGAIYTFEVHLGNSKFSDSPELVLGKFEYGEHIPLNGKDPSVSDHWMFYHPTRKNNDFKQTQQGDDIVIAIPENDNVIKRYKGLVKVTHTRKRLMDVTSENLDSIFKDLLAL